MEDSFIRIPNDPSSLLELRREEIRLRRRNASLENLQINLSEYKRNILNQIDYYNSAHQNIENRISSILSSIRARFYLIANEVDSEISNIDTRMEDRSDLPDLYIDKLSSHGLRAVLNNYEDLTAPNINFAMIDLNTRLNSELLYDNEDMNIYKKEIQRVNLMLEESRKREKYMQEQIQVSSDTIKKVQDELYNMKSRYKEVVSNFVKVKESLEKEVQKLTRMNEDSKEKLNNLTRIKNEHEGIALKDQDSAIEVETGIKF